MTVFHLALVCYLKTLHGNGSGTRQHDGLLALSRACAAEWAAWIADGDDTGSGSAEVPRGGGSGIVAGDEVGTREAADMLGCTDRNVRDLIARGALPGRRAGGAWRIARAEVAARRA